jgi:hypothetical protein
MKNIIGLDRLGSRWPRARLGIKPATMIKPIGTIASGLTSTIPPNALASGGKDVTGITARRKSQRYQTNFER